MTSSNYRKRIIDHIKLLAHPSEQLEYERSVRIANVPAELLCIFCDDLYHPKNPDFIEAFSEEELKGLAELYGLLSFAAKAKNYSGSSVTELLKQPEWRTVIALAKELSAYYQRAI